MPGDYTDGNPLFKLVYEFVLDPLYNGHVIIAVDCPAEEFTARHISRLLSDGLRLFAMCRTGGDELPEVYDVTDCCIYDVTDRKVLYGKQAGVWPKAEM